MTKAPLGGGKTGPNPTGRGKRGTKRRLLTEAAGMSIGLAVAGANRNDFTRARPPLASLPVVRPMPTPRAPPGLCRGRGYDFDEVRGLGAEFGYTAHIR